MKHETITLDGEELDVYYQITEGMPSTSRDVPDDEDELVIISIENDGKDILMDLFFDELDEIKKLLIDKILT